MSTSDVILFGGGFLVAVVLVSTAWSIVELLRGERRIRDVERRVDELERQSDARAR